jgi:hypothetical protein
MFSTHVIPLDTEQKRNHGLYIIKSGTANVGTTERIDVLVTGTSTCKDVPEGVKKALVGVTIPTFFTKKRLLGMLRHSKPETRNKIKSLPDHSRISFFDHIEEALMQAGKTEAVAELKAHPQLYKLFYTLEKECFEIVKTG